jgi:hypothetical protein
MRVRRLLDWYCNLRIKEAYCYKLVSHKIGLGPHSTKHLFVDGNRSVRQVSSLYGANAGLRHSTIPTPLLETSLHEF